MKLPELKKQFKNKYVIRIIAGVLVVALVGTGVSSSTVHAAKNEAVEETIEEMEENEVYEAIEDSVSVSEGNYGKEETVYVISDNMGNPNKVIVSDHLLNGEKQETLTDKSSLQDIENVKGKETFSQNGDALVWDADGKDIYYQGTSDAKLPVTQKITYFLDGKEITPEELAGKSGRVTIRFDYTNNEIVKTTIDGKKEEVCVPFVALSGMIMDDSFTNIEVSNGKVVADGNKNLVFGYTLPGLADALDVEEEDFDEDISIPDYFEVTADVENFALDMSMTVVANATEFLKSDDLGDLGNLDEDLNTLEDASKQLQDGSAQLADGTDTLKDGMGDFTTGAGTLKDGVAAYTDGASKLADGIAQLSGKSPELMNGVNKLNSSAASLNSGVALLQSSLNTAFTEEEKANLQNQVNNTIAGQESMIKESAKNAVVGQSDAIKAQASAAIDAQADTIKNQAVATVDAQADAIKMQAKQSVDDTFANGKYAEIEAQATAQASANLTDAGTVASVSTGIKQSDAYYYMAQGIRAVALQEVMTQSGGTITTMDQAAAAFQAANGISVDDFAAAQAAGAADTLSSGIMTQIAAQAAPTVGASVAGAAQLAAETAAQDAAVAGARVVAGEAAIAGAKGAATEAAISGATQAAQTAAVEGARSAAQTAAVSAAEQTKKTIAQSIEAENESGYSLVTGMAALAAGTQSLEGAMPTLADGISQLYNGSQELVGNNAALNDGTNQLCTGAGTIADGVTKLNDGAHELADGMVQFNEEGIEKILNAYNGDIEPLIERMQAVIDAGEEYQIYTELADGMTGNVKFIYRTEAVKED